jgi:hypothetical protein
MAIRGTPQHKGVPVESRPPPRTSQRHSALLQELERAYPGITRVQRDLRGAVILGAPGDVWALVRQMREASQHTNSLK